MNNSQLQNTLNNKLILLNNQYKQANDIIITLIIIIILMFIMLFKLLFDIQNKFIKNQKIINHNIKNILKSNSKKEKPKEPEEIKEPEKPKEPEERNIYMIFRKEILKQLRNTTMNQYQKNKYIDELWKIEEELNLLKKDSNNSNELNKLLRIKEEKYKSYNLTII